MAGGVSPRLWALGLLVLVGAVFVGCIDSSPSAEREPEPIAQAVGSPARAPDIRATVLAEITATALAQPTRTRTPAPTATAAPVPTDTPTLVPTNTPTPVPTHTPTPVPTDTPTPVPTDTPTPVPTDTPTPVPTETPTPVPTETPTPVPTETPTPVPTDTPTPVPTDTPTPVPTDTPTPVPVETPTPAPTSTPTLAVMVEDVSPGVVQIWTGDGGSGSGFIIDTDGLVITNAHVVRDFATVEVRIPGGTTYVGSVLGVDEIADLALIDLGGVREFEPTVFGNSGTTSVGDEVIAMGFPLGDRLGSTPTITRGIVSAKRRSGDGVDLLQTDAAMNPGSSGGPLFDRGGAVVGVNTSKLFEADDGRPVEGIGLAVAINEVKDRLDELKEGQAVVRPTPTAVGSPTPVVLRTRDSFSVGSFDLEHKDDGLIETLNVLGNVRNFLASTEFKVPYSPHTGSWNAGFLFRNPAKGSLSYVVVTQDGEYIHSLRQDGETSVEDRGYLYGFDSEQGAVISLTLIVLADRGWLFVNSEYITDLDISGASESGELEVVTGVYTGSEIPGHSTSFNYAYAERLVELSGPLDGNLTKDSSSIAVQRAGVDVEFGFATTEFRVPDTAEDWSVGLIFRKRTAEDYLLFRIASSGIWSVDHATPSGEDWQTLEEGYSSEIDLKTPVLNRLEVLFTGEVAIVYVNGVDVGTSDISSVTGDGDIMVAYGVYSNDDHGTARFEEFTVWGYDE